MPTESPAAFARRWGLASEAAEYLDEVEAWRTVWKPPDNEVRVVLLAESHVAEQPGDVEARVVLPPGVRSPFPLPSRYVRLVHCLGYGENALCSRPVSKNHTGTIQYWDMFGAIAHGSVDAIQPRKSATPGASGLRQRIGWKLTALARLREYGVWLLDVSPVGLYVPGGERLSHGARYASLMRDAYRHFVEPQLARFRRLEQTWVIGYELADALLPCARERLDRARVVIQPQGQRARPGQLPVDLERLIRSLPVKHTSVGSVMPCHSN